MSWLQIGIIKFKLLLQIAKVFKLTDFCVVLSVPFINRQWLGSEAAAASLIPVDLSVLVLRTKSWYLLADIWLWNFAFLFSLLWNIKPYEIPFETKHIIHCEVSIHIQGGNFIFIFVLLEVLQIINVLLSLIILLLMFTVDVHHPGSGLRNYSFERYLNTDTQIFQRYLYL